MIDEKLIQNILNIVRDASNAVMKIYNSGDFGVEIKADHTPLTKADKTANQIIETGLKSISKFPILSEEGAHEVGNTDIFWCVDPIDGTKEFIRRNGEFTINIGLVKNGEPVLGVVGVPARGEIYYGAKGHGAFKQSDDEVRQIKANFSGDKPVVVSHHSIEPELQKLLDKIGDYELIVVGSSLKFCLVAEGRAALYPRFYGSHLWDTAAADAVLRTAGGETISNRTNESLVYNPAEIKNPFFIAAGGNYELFDRT